MSERIVIVGAGLAGAEAAETLRQEGFGGQVVLVGAEPERPYERPPLSKGILTGSANRDSAFVHSPDWYAENDVELRTGTRVERIDRGSREVTLDGAQRLTYDKSYWRPVIAAPPAWRVTTSPACVLRTLRDGDRSAKAWSRVRVVVIGAAGSASRSQAARQRGATVTSSNGARLLAGCRKRGSANVLPTPVMRDVPLRPVGK
jgi:NADPH-dependent 2,4-dienoyl-CoA reductase/sulfur reductase-like enzyme